MPLSIDADFEAALRAGCAPRLRDRAAPFATVARLRCSRVNE